MYNEFFSCTDLDGNTRIWKYFKYDYFVSVLKTGKLWFSQVDTFDDKFEGWYPANDKKRHKLFKSYKSHTYANCWHIRDHESFLMWEVYGSDENNKGIAIQSTFERLKQSLNDSKFEEHINIVNYVDFEKPYNIKNNTLAPFFIKSKEYNDEREIRAIIQIMNPNEWHSHYKKMLVPVRLNELIENIYVYPRASNDFYKSVQTIVYESDLKIVVKPPKKILLEDEEEMTLKAEAIDMINNGGSDQSGNYQENYTGGFNVIGQNIHFD